ncbi:MAG: flagellar basal body-associated FliL family protein [Limnohabitans sp.]|nr:flagellar basal body-associated FliL family protein [Limnohabitans sp.]
MATAPEVAPEGEEAAPKKKKPILLILGIAFGSIVVMVGVAFGTLYFSGFYEKKAELAAMDKLEELEAAATKAKDEAPAKLRKEAPEATRFEKNYLQLEKDLMTNITGSKKVMVVNIVLMTHYDTRVFDNVKKHEFALRSAMLDIMRQATEEETKKPDFRKELAEKLKEVMNKRLEEYEDFGGIEEIYFNSFVMQ